MLEAILSRTLLLVGYYIVTVSFTSTAPLAADAEDGKILANRWCSSCHVVGHEQKLATDKSTKTIPVKTGAPPSPTPASNKAAVPNKAA